MYLNNHAYAIRPAMMSPAPTNWLGSGGKVCPVSQPSLQYLIPSAHSHDMNWEDRAGVAGGGREMGTHPPPLLLLLLLLLAIPCTLYLLILLSNASLPQNNNFILIGLRFKPLIVYFFPGQNKSDSFRVH